MAVRDKGGTLGPVTDADLAVEGQILERLRAQFPDDAILSEESGQEGGSTGRLWCVDPIDGTREYIEGRPEYAVQIGLLVDGEPVAGAVALPATGEVFWGWQGGGAWCGERPVTLPELDDLAAASVIHSRSHRDGLERAIERLQPRHRIVAGSCGYKVSRLLTGDAHYYLHAGRGVSRTMSTSRLRSLSTTSAAREMRLSVTPVAVAASVFMEHGATIIPSVRKEPLAILAPISRSECTTSASASSSLRRMSSSVATFSNPARETIR